MSVSTQTQIRLPKIKEGLVKGLTREQIGKSCGVTERTIRRDIETWLQSGNFETWLKEEFLRLHSTILKAYPETAYREVSRLVGKMLTRRIEAHSIEEIKVEEKHVSITANLSQYDRAIEEELKRLSKSHSTQQ